MSIPRLDKLDRNLIINSRMDFWQRGTTYTNTRNTNGSDAKFLADRFRSYVSRGTSTNFNLTVQLSTSVPPTSMTNGVTLPYSMQILANAAHTLGAADRYDMAFHPIEGGFLNEIGQTDTLYYSGYMYTNRTGTTNVGIFMAAANVSTSQYYSDYVALTANTWTYFEKAITLPNLAFYRDTNAGITVGFGNAGGSSSQQTSTKTWNSSNSFAADPNSTNYLDSSGNYLLVTGLRLSKYQATQTPCWAGRNGADEYRLCQRYYELFSGSLLGANYGTNIAYSGPYYYAALKRANPTIAFTTLSGGFNFTGASLNTLNGNSQDKFSIVVNNSQAQSISGSFNIAGSADCEL